MTSWDAFDPFADARQAAGVMSGDYLGEPIPLILRYRDVRDAASNYTTFSSDAPFRVPVPSEEHVRNVRQLPIETDPPDHTDYRRIVKPFFSAPKQPEMGRRMRALVRRMIDDAARKDSVEVVNEVALPLQCKALAMLLRMPADCAEEWIGWGHNVFVGAEGHSPDKGDALHRYLERQLDRAAAKPDNDFFSALTQSTFRGRPLTRDEMLGFANLAFAGGRDTVISTVCLAIAHLAAHPEDMARIRNQPRLIRSAVEEIFRVATPLSFIGRVCPHGANVGGLEVSRGSRAGICWASANRDETVFEKPETLDIGRTRNPHMAFGSGAHTCLGASHARLVIRTLIEVLSQETTELSLISSKPRYEEWPAYRRQTGYEALHVKLRRRVPAAVEVI